MSTVVLWRPPHDGGMKPLNERTDIDVRLLNRPSKEQRAAPVACHEKMSSRAARNIIEMLDGTPDPGFVVNPEVPPNRRNL